MLSKGYVRSPNSTTALSTSWSSGILLSATGDTGATALPSSPHLLDLKVLLSSATDGVQVYAYLSFDAAGAEVMAGVSAAATVAVISGGLGGCAFSLDLTIPPYWAGETRGQCYLWLKLSAGVATLTARGAVLGWSDEARY